MIRVQLKWESVTRVLDHLLPAGIELHGLEIRVYTSQNAVLYLLVVFLVLYVCDQGSVTQINL